MGRWPGFHGGNLQKKSDANFALTYLLVTLVGPTNWTVKHVKQNLTYRTYNTVLTKPKISSNYY